MFDTLRAFFAGLSHPPAAGAHDDPRVAAAALLVHVMDADGVRDAAEEAVLRRALVEACGVSQSEADGVVAAGETADREAVDLHGFTSVLMRHWDETERRRFVALLWDVVFADDTLHELEDHTLWRIGDLLGVDSRDRVEARRRAAALARARRGA